MPTHPWVRFEPSGALVEVPAGSTILEAAIRAGVAVSADCGGAGRCGRCAVEVIDGVLCEPDDLEAFALARTPEFSRAVRLACRARVAGTVTVKPLAITATTTQVSLGLTHGVFVAAVDLGTSRVSARILDRDSGVVLGEGTVVNSQMVWGADVLSRVAAALGGDYDALVEAARSSVRAALTAARVEVGIAPGTLVSCVVAANPVMASFMAGTDVSGFAAHPFTSSLETADRQALAASIGAEEVRFVPMVGAFVGGDLVAGIVSLDPDVRRDGLVYVDIGTNAEVAVFVEGKIYVTSAPAGPSLEGWGVSCGGGIGPGGVTRVTLEGEGITLRVEDGSPRYLSGSAVVSAVHALRSAGHLSPDGLLVTAGPLEQRMFTRADVRSVSLAEHPGDRSLFITQLDIRSVQSALAAIAAAVKSVMRAASVSAVPRRAVVTGALGFSGTEAALVDLGVLPANVAGSISFTRNAALAGAVMCAQDRAACEAAAEIARTAILVDLANTDGFSQLFNESLSLAPYAV